VKFSCVFLFIAGLEIHLKALRSFEPPEWKHVSLGSAVLAEAGNGLWKAAELESWDEGQQCASIVFSADGTRVEVLKNDLALSEYASVSDASSDSSASEDEPSDDDDDADEFFSGVAASGVQNETVTFAGWERHTRGVASKMMANMGFREGMGLGKAGQGITQPVKVQIRPEKQSLGYAKENQDAEKPGKKKSRGGKRKRDQKWAAAQRAAKSKMEVMEETRNVFDFINNKLAAQTTDTRPSRHSMNGQAVRDSKQSLEKANRATIVAHEDEIKKLRSKVNKLQEMATRNRKEKAVYEAAGRKLVEARKALASAEAAHATTTNAVHSKEKERKWLRF
jgi:hypothetical protein